MGSDQDGTFDPFKQFGIFGIAFLIINAVLLFMGLGLVTVGAQALNELSKINSENIKPLLELDSVQAVVMVTAVSIILIVIGILLTLGAFGLGIAGAYFKTKFILLQYAIFVLILLLMKIVVIALWFTMKNEVETDMQDKMVTILHSYYLDDGTTSSYPISNAWNYLFLTLGCCGVNPVLSTTNDFDGTSWCTTSGSCQATVSQIPKTCCLNINKNNYTSAPSACHASVNSGTYNTKGCYAALKEKLLYHSLSIIVLALTTTFIEVKALSLVFLIRGKNRQQCLTLCRNMCVSPSVGVAPDKSRWI
nr:tetraspanin-4-like isoform X1 [Crassostrea gigas]XP_019919577.2 tetraspanin-4-like isoform X1 [Crassostrea gigas]XP_034337311.1 tetraspanin-4-like isoform X1 [Crassostrea gigas]